MQQYAARHFGQLYFAAGVAQTAQGRSGRGIGVFFASDAARAGCCSCRCALLWVSVGGSAGEAVAQACFIAALRSRRLV